MKKLHALIVAALALLVLPACQTTGSGPSSAVQLELAVGVASDAAALVLQKNPKAVPVLRSISAGIDSVLTTESLSPEKVKAFVDKIGKDSNLSPAERLIIGRAIQRVHGVLVVYFNTPDLSISDPRVRAALTKIKQSIDDTLALHAVLES